MQSVDLFDDAAAVEVPPRKTTNEAASTSVAPKPKGNNGAETKEDDLAATKSEYDMYRQRTAHIKAMKLFNAVAGGDQFRGGATYMAENHDRQVVPGRAATDKPVRKEDLTETTRKIVPKKLPLEGEEGFGCETIDDFKCQLDLDREKWAQAKALRLLYGSPFD